MRETRDGDVIPRQEYAQVFFTSDQSDWPQSFQLLTLICACPSQPGAQCRVNNTFVENASTGNNATSLYSETMTTPIVLFNNIFKNIEGEEGSELVMNNLNSNAYIFNNVLDTVNHVNCSGGWDGKDNINIDPAFWDDSCHLNCYIPSPCIDAGIEELEIEGTTYFAPGFDFEGEIRPMDQAHDIGADETMICVYIDENRPNNPDINIKVFPNPFESMVTIDYSLNRPCYISLGFYNLLGDEVANIEEGSHNSGTYSVNWNFEALPSGIYFYRFTAGDKVATGKVIKR